MTHLHGFSGHLVTPSFLARSCDEHDGNLAAPWRAGAAVCAVARRELGPASSVRHVFDTAVAPLVVALGLDPPGDVRVHERYVAASVVASGRALALVAVSWAEPMDGFWRAAVVEAQRRGAAWCLVFNGVQLRILDASRLYTRRSVECDLGLAFDRLESFSALFRLVGDAALFREASDARSLHALAAASERDAAAVCRSLQDGVLAASSDVLAALLGRQRTLADDVVAAAFDQSLTIVYRLVFLLFAEARALVPLWHPVYRESYSVEALRETSERSSPISTRGALPPGARGLWDALRAMARLAHAGCRAGDLRVTAFNGRLFAPARTPLAERRGLDDGAARRAVLALSTRPTPDRTGSARIAYGELGVEQLGAVYETLLDYQPRVIAADNRPGKPSVALEAGSGVRKATGTFYTPQPLASYLVRRTLAPLVRDRAPDAILAVRVVDPAMGSGAFLVAACRYLAEAYEQAQIQSGAFRAGDFGDSDRVAIRRLVAERCIYGVDLNPMAVQLARLSLWLATLAVDRPLSFLDHRLMVGDSLIGVWLRQLRDPPGRPARRDAPSSLPLFKDERLADVMSAALPVRFSLEETPNETVEDVRIKERALASLSRPSSALARWKRVADLWCATWFAKTSGDLPAEAYRSLADDVLSGAGALPASTTERYLARAATIAGAHRFFHWELEFPEVFFDVHGRRLTNSGFDAVIGNPPWDMMRADPAGGAGEGGVNGRERERAEVAKAVRFTRDAGVYRAQSRTHTNRYQLFVERAMALTRAQGRIGLVLPSGLAVDYGSAPLRRALFSTCDVDAMVGLDNTRGIFPIHRSVRFLLLTATSGRPTERLQCRFGVESASELETIGEDGAGEAFPVELTTAALGRLSGRSLSVPRLRHAVDLRICEKAAALFSPLGSAEGWAASFGRELNATDDKAAFRPPGQGWPVLDGRHLEPFRVATARASRGIDPADARRLLGPDRAERPRLAYRDVASATNRLTLIAAVLPAFTVSTHTLFCLKTALALRDQHALCGLFNSFVVNYLVRLRVTTHVTTALIEQLPIPSPADAPAACHEVAAAARLLSRRHDAEVSAALNARVARLYQLTTEEFEHVLSTFPLIAVEERRSAMLAFRAGRGV